MSYRAGLNFPPHYSLPRITCDGCGAFWPLPTNRPPPSWFLDGKGPKGWRTTRTGDVRDDRCPQCVAATPPKGDQGP